MKRSASFLIVLLGIFLLFAGFMTPTNPVPADQPKGIPDSVWNVLKKCCLDCHSTNGGTMARAHVDFDKWDTYSRDQQFAKAKDICDELLQGKMPPGKYRKNNPGVVPTAKENEVVCNWVRQIEK